MAHTSVILQEWQTFNECLNSDDQPYLLSGRKLSLGAVVAISKYSVVVEIDETCSKVIAASAAALAASLDVGQIVYGVNTGFGGSADSRSKQVEALQATLIRELHCGLGASPVARRYPATNGHGPTARNRLNHSESAENLLHNAWVRASILIRINSLIGGYSGIRQVVIKTLSQLLNYDIIPRVPLRGSISASGDLSPLSYIAGSIQGKSTIRVQSSRNGTVSDMTAAEALATAGIAPVKLMAKEGLAIVNGTAVSAGVASLAVWETHHLAVLAQLLTSMSVEALCGTDESFDPLLARVRPHPGQIDCSNNIYRFLQGSKLVYHNDGKNDLLRQDRYSIRTASQWLGPILEDLLLAHQQVEIEFNSVTDNPIIDRETDRVVHGGNFQAKAITSAMEKVRQALQSIGRLLFCQCTELINPVTNRGLPPNLTAEDPSISWVMKAVDIMIAALQSELGFLANPVGSHVQTAEMGNQALNSLALISARYTHTAVDVLAQLAAAHLFAVCQALDLRAFDLAFQRGLEPQLMQATQQAFAQDSGMRSENGGGHPMLEELWSSFLVRLEQTTKMDADRRFRTIMESLHPVIIRYSKPEQQYSSSSSSSSDATFVSTLQHWTNTCALLCQHTFTASMEAYSRHPDATPYLGIAARRMYVFVRRTLRVPFLRAAHIRTPYPETMKGDSTSVDEPNGDEEEGYHGSGNPDSNTVGSYIGTIYEALRSGELYGPAMECLRDIR
ncbi:MAG: hypothetical protein Q9202_007359 [Teloschistes flavicans]